MHRLALTLLLLVALGPGRAAAQDAGRIQFIDPDPRAARAAGVVVRDAPVAHTTQLLPLDAQGRLVGAGSAAQQATRVLENLRLVLAEAGADLGDLVKLNVYVARDALADEVSTYLTRALRGKATPAISYVAGNLRHADALVAMDAVAVPPHPHDGLHIYHADGVAGLPGLGHLAVAPARSLVYISGQVASNEDLTKSMRESLEASHARMAYLGLSNDDVVQVKVFVEDLAAIDGLEREIAAYYRHKPAPPIVFVEWVHPGANIEIELLAAKAPARDADGEAVTFTTPPGLQHATGMYSRVAEINHGGVLFLSSLYGDASGDARTQTLDIYAQMGRLLEKAGTDFDHLLKATYYLSNWDDARKALGELRPQYYKPDRPPTSSLIPVRGTGRQGTALTIDMIGVVPR